MKKIKIILLGLLLSCTCLSQKQPPYFYKQSYFYNKSNYIVKGTLIDKKGTAFIGYDSIVAVQICLLDKFDFDIEDTIWVYPDFEHYYNKKKIIDTSNRDTVIVLEFEDINFESCTHISYDKYGLFTIGQDEYCRFWKENDKYVYSIEDCYFPLVINNNKVNVELNKWKSFVNTFIPYKKFNEVSVKRFDRKLKKKLEKRNHEVKSQ
jgi:hypothetical protein